MKATAKTVVLVLASVVIFYFAAAGIGTFIDLLDRPGRATCLGLVALGAFLIAVAVEKRLK